MKRFVNNKELMAQCEICLGYFLWPSNKITSIKEPTEVSYAATIDVSMTLDERFDRIRAICIDCNIKREMFKKINK